MAKHETEDYVGTCPCCFGEFKVRDIDNANHRMVMHGFSRPGIGYLIGGCLGVDQIPFEYSTAGTLSGIEQLKLDIAGLTKQIEKTINAVRVTAPFKEDQKVRTRYITTDHMGRISDKKYTFADGDGTLIDARAQTLEKLRRAIVECEHDIMFMEWNLPRWEKGTIVGYDSPITGKPRFLRRAATVEEQNQMMELGIPNITALDDYLKSKAKNDKEDKKAIVLVFTKPCVATPYSEEMEPEQAEFKAEINALKGKFVPHILKTRVSIKDVWNLREHTYIHHAKFVMGCGLDDLGRLVADRDAKGFSDAKERGYTLTL
jgi:hypothetical protein